MTMQIGKGTKFKYLRKAGWIYSLMSLIFCILLMATPSGYCEADKLDPFNAVFELKPGPDSSKFDISAKLDFAIHNNVEGKLTGSKFLCKENIDSLTVADQYGKRLLYTVKAYPRKKLIWEYPVPVNGKRSISIRFMIRDAVKLVNNQYVINIDWLGGWKRSVLNSKYKIILPEGFSKESISQVFPNNYRVMESNNRVTIIHDLPDPDTKGLKVILNNPAGKNIQPGPAPAKKKRRSVKLKSEHKGPPAAGALLKKIRCAKHSKKSDRIIFELSREIPFEININEKKKEVELHWKEKLAVNNALLKNKKINTTFIESYSWKKIKNKDLVSVVKLKENNTRVRYGSLENPARVYLDLSRKIRIKPTVKIKKEKKLVRKKLKTQKRSSVPQIIKSRIKPENKSLVKTKGVQLEKIIKSQNIPGNVPIEEKILYKNALKVLESGDHHKAIEAFNDLLLKFPDTSLEENIYYHIADAKYLLAEKDPGSSYREALNAYRKASIKFPDSNKTSSAVFKIGECKRKDGLLMEAVIQYKYYLKQYPEGKSVMDASYWICELNYRLKKYRSSLEGFESFIKKYPKSAYLKEAAFRIGDCHFKLNDFDRAEYFYEKAFKKWPEMAELPSESLNNIAITFYYKGDFKKSRDIFMLSFNRFPDQEDRDMLLRYCADSYQWEGDMQKALNLYGLQAELFPQSKETMLSVMRMADIGVNVSGLDASNCFFKGFNPYNSPEKTYLWLIKNDKSGETWTEAYYKIGFLNAKKGDYETALNYFKKSMNRKSTGVYHKKSIDNITKMLVNLIEQADAQNDHLRVVELYSKNRESFLKTVDDCVFINRVAASYIDYGLLEGAEDMLKKVYHNADQAGCRHRAALSLAAIDLDREHYSKASDKMKLLLYGGDYLEQQIEDEAHFILGDASFFLKAYQDAVSAYSGPLKNTEVNPGNYSSVLRFGKSFGYLGYYFNGIHSINRYIALIENSSINKTTASELKENAMMIIVDYLTKTKNYEAAISVLKKVQQSTSDIDIKLLAGITLADLFLKSGKKNDSLNQYNNVAQKGPYNFYGTLAINRLNNIKWDSKNSKIIQDFL